MPRFSSLTQAPAETRRLLRGRFSRFLPAEPSPRLPSEQPVLDDELFLQLMLGLEITSDGDLASARAIFETAAAGIADHPSLDSLLEQGAIRVTWGRVSLLPPHRPGESAIAPLPGVTALQTHWHKQRFQLSADVHRRDDLAPHAKSIEKTAGVPVTCQTPEWVAARLWDRSPMAKNHPKAALRQWLDRWVAIGAPALVPHRAWNSKDATLFVDTALDVLANDAQMPGWPARRSNIIAELALANRRPRESIECYVLPLPETAVARALWLDDHQIEQPLMEALMATDDIFGLLRVPLSEIEHTALSPAPNPLASRLFPIILERLDLFHILLFWIVRHPRVLVDLLLFPPTAALACMLVARRQPPHDAWNRDLTLRDHQAARVSAFADAASVMGHGLSQSTVPPEEAAALLAWLHSDRAVGATGGEESTAVLIGILRGELVGQSTDTLKGMATALMDSFPNGGIEAPEFAAALDLVEMGDLAKSVDPAPYVDVYLRSIGEGAYNLTAHRISQGAATTLFFLAGQLPTAQRSDFLFPLAVEHRIKTVGDDNPYSLADSIARSTRCHIRVLCRAIAGLIEDQPTDLVDALVAALRPVPTKIQGYASVTPFAPRFEIEGAYAKRDRPIAADIGAALTALPTTEAERVLSALLETSEPMILAQILTYAPRAMRERIETRAGQVSPADAGDIRSLPEAQARIDTLLAAGLTGSAAKYIHEERNVRTMGKAPRAGTAPC